MIKRDQLVSYLNDYLAIDDITDTCYNGLQFQGADTIAHAAFAVDACVETIQAAAEQNADILITHHGHFWQNNNPSIVGWQKKRIDLLYQHNLSLYAAHLPLDRHPEVGNNVQLLKLLGADIADEFGLREGKNVGYSGTLKPPRDLHDIEKQLNQDLPTTCHVLSHGPTTISTIAVITGTGGYQGVFDAINANVDLFITGDTVDVYQLTKDAHLNVIFAGHNATETLGVKALAAHLQQSFNLSARFIAAPTNL